MLDGRASGPSSASSASHSALSFSNGNRQAGGTPDPASAISSIYSHEGGVSMERDGSTHLLPDLEKLSLDLGRELDVEDLDDEGWMAASKAGKVDEISTLGEGAGGAVTKCRLKGGKTVFALKVCQYISCCNDCLSNPIRLSRQIPIQKCRNRSVESWSLIKRLQPIISANITELLVIHQAGSYQSLWSIVRGEVLIAFTRRSRNSVVV